MTPPVELHRANPVVICLGQAQARALARLCDIAARAPIGASGKADPPLSQLTWEDLTSIYALKEQLEAHGA